MLAREGMLCGFFHIMVINIFSRQSVRICGSHHAMPPSWWRDVKTRRNRQRHGDINTLGDRGAQVSMFILSQAHKTMSNRSLFLLLNTSRLAFASRRVAAASSSTVLLLMPLPAASSPRHARVSIKLNGVRNQWFRLRGAATKVGETPRWKMLERFIVRAHCTSCMYCHNCNFVLCARFFLDRFCKFS